MDLRFPKLQELRKHLSSTLRHTQLDAILLHSQCLLLLLQTSPKIVVYCLPFPTRREHGKRLDLDRVGAVHHARLPQQVLDGDGRLGEPMGFGTDSFPRGRAVFATVGLGSMCGGFVPPPNAMNHRLSYRAPGDTGAGRILMRSLKYVKYLNLSIRARYSRAVHSLPCGTQGSPPPGT